MILDKAEEIITKRIQQYGNCDVVFTEVAAAFNAITGTNIKAADVCVMQILLKLKRSQSSPKNEDHYIDIAGYADLMARINK